MPDVTVRGVRFHVQTIGPPAPGAPVAVFLHGLVLDNLSSFYYTIAGPVAEAGAHAVCQSSQRRVQQVIVNRCRC